MLKVGDIVKLIPYHKDDRLAVIESIKGETIILSESRAGYFIWNIYDIEKIKK